MSVVWLKKSFSVEDVITNLYLKSCTNLLLVNSLTLVSWRSDQTAPPSLRGLIISTVELSSRRLVGNVIVTSLGSIDWVWEPTLVINGNLKIFGLSPPPYPYEGVLWDKDPSPVLYWYVVYCEFPTGNEVSVMFLPLKLLELTVRFISWCCIISTYEPVLRNLPGDKLLDE